MLCPLCPVEEHSTHKKIRVSEQFSGLGRFLADCVASEVTELQALEKLVGETKKVVAKCREGRLAMLEQVQTAVTQHFEDYKEEIKINCEEAAENMDDFVARMSQCSESDDVALTSQTRDVTSRGSPAGGSGEVGGPEREEPPSDRFLNACKFQIRLHEARQNCILSVLAEIAKLA